VSVGTVRRDGAFSAAVNRIVANYGAEAKPLLLDSRLSRDAIFALDAMPPSRQRQRVAGWLIAKKVRRWSQNGGRKDTITLPRPLKELVNALIDRLGWDDAAEANRLLGEALENWEPDN